MRPSSFFGVLVVAVASLPAPQSSDPLAGNLLQGGLLQSVGDLLGTLLGSNSHEGHEEPSLFPCLFGTTSCVSDCTADCIRKLQGCGSCLSSCLKDDTCSAKEPNYFDREGEQEIGGDDREVAAASRVDKVPKGKTAKEAATRKINKAAMRTKTHSSPDLPK